MAFGSRFATFRTLAAKPRWFKSSRAYQSLRSLFRKEIPPPRSINPATISAAELGSGTEVTSSMTGPVSCALTAVGPVDSGNEGDPLAGPVVVQNATYGSVSTMLCDSNATIPRLPDKYPVSGGRMVG
jgi:hypothetical protein